MPLLVTLCQRPSMKEEAFSIFVPGSMAPVKPEPTGTVITSQTFNRLWRTNFCRSVHPAWLELLMAHHQQIPSKTLRRHLHFEDGLLANLSRLVTFIAAQGMQAILIDRLFGL